MTYIEELQAVVRRLHGADATHVESVPIKETFQGQTVREGIVEVFNLEGHPTASRVYAWVHDTDDPNSPRRHVTVLHLHPSARDAVRAAIVQEFRSVEPEAGNRKPGRPRLPKGEAKGKIMPVRFTQAEATAFAKAAKSKGQRGCGAR